MGLPAPPSGDDAALEAPLTADDALARSSPPEPAPLTRCSSYGIAMPPAAAVAPALASAALIFPSSSLPSSGFALLVPGLPLFDPPCFRILLSVEFHRFLIALSVLPGRKRAICAQLFPRR
eukprot:scaffold340_cov256-Pinguiococcus_pyrenoidosus.AAC.14